MEPGAAMLHRCAVSNACCPKLSEEAGLGLLGGKAQGSQVFGSFRKLGVPYLGVLIIRILLFRVPY